MSYNSYGGQFQGIGGMKGQTPKKQPTTNNPSLPKKENKPASKVILCLSELRDINMPEVENGDIYFVCTTVFDNDDVKQSMETSNYNSEMIKGQFLFQKYVAEFSEEIVLNIPDNSNFVRCYVSALTVKEEDGKRTIKLEGIGYTDPFITKFCQVFPYAKCKLNTAVGANETQGNLKLCVKCVDSSHPSVVKASEPFNIIQELKKIYD
ncbi:conserved protein, unknown function [Hepatocystis sp. ex Piliocolobus tephrosceles]|nr:conserved protein, unknown function [Hepatocystis sp. ex Piliocolobus tephrosceles]